jgi:cellulose synthase/poly-beta-1,6-N-acetylglucosamine synthase-like glycosyltransferase
LIALLSTLSILLTVVYLSVLIYLIRGWNIIKRTPIKTSGFTTKVTIMIAARNEAEKIHFTIEDILAQTYPKELKEIIIVDDHSTDRTSEIISSYADRGVKLLKLNEDKPLNSYKKKAISEAIGLSTGELMVATDADCRMGSKWLASIVSYYENEELVMISSPVSYFEERTLFEKMQALEFYYLIGLGAAFIGNGHAATCNGANLAYRKDVFYDVGGFTGIDHIASGDDELLLQKVAARYKGKVGFLKRYDAVVFTHAKKNSKEFIQQRRRWASKSVHYKDKKVVAVLVAIWAFNVSMLVNACLGFIDPIFFKLLGIQLLLKYLFELAYLLPVSSFFKRPWLVILLLLIIPVHVFYLIYIGFVGKNTTYSWKGREVR